MKCLPLKHFIILITLGVTFLLRPIAGATEADDTEITLTGKKPGPTALIYQLTLIASQTNALKSIQFTVTPKPGSVTRPLSGTLSRDYLADRGYIDLGTGEIFLPVWGLYRQFSNTVTLTYLFNDGSSKAATTTIVTADISDNCGEYTPTIIQPRARSSPLSYDYFFIRGICDDSPVILDTDGEVRWISPFSSTPHVKESSSNFFDNAVYVTRGSVLHRVDLDGTVSIVADYGSLGIVEFHHNIDPGKTGMILDATTDAYIESVNLEVDASGNILKMWNIADIISAAMLMGGDDPSQFVYPSPNDWFHNNSVAYRRSDDSLLLSSRENFVICLDYDTLAIRWILGDQTKKWHEFPSLAQYALTLSPGGIPPIGQHALSITVDNNVLLMDNGRYSGFQEPPGLNLNMSLPRKYLINPAQRSATELMEYPGIERFYSLFCGSAYEDAKSNYLVDYSSVAGKAEILGFEASGAKSFEYTYPTVGCTVAYNSFPLHLESTRLPAVGPQALNLSTRANIGTGDNALIGGFIVTGKGPKSVVLRALGPSLSAVGVAGALADPVLSVMDSSGALIASNDDWGTDENAATIVGDQLAPDQPSEAATLLTLLPGAYTVVVSGKRSASGIGLVEAYDLSPLGGSLLANISSRGLVDSGENALIAGFIIGDVGSATVVVRGLGPSLPPENVRQSLTDPILTIHDAEGTEIASNDNWEDDPNASSVAGNGLAPNNAAESAVLLNLPAGAYSAVLKGADDGGGVGLVEVYSLR